MSKNVGCCDAYLKTAAGFMLIGLGILKRKGCYIVAGSLEVASGVTRYSPLYDVLQFSSVSDEEILDDCLMGGYDCSSEVIFECEDTEPMDVSDDDHVNNYKASDFEEVDAMYDPLEDEQ